MTASSPIKHGWSSQEPLTKPKINPTSPLDETPPGEISTQVLAIQHQIGQVRLQTHFLREHLSPLLRDVDTKDHAASIAVIQPCTGPVSPLALRLAEIAAASKELAEIIRAIRVSVSI